MIFVVSTSAVDCVERLISEMTCYVSSGTLNPTHSLTEVISTFWPLLWQWYAYLLKPYYYDSL